MTPHVFMLKKGVLQHSTGIEINFFTHKEFFACVNFFNKQNMLLGNFLEAKLSKPKISLKFSNFSQVYGFQFSLPLHKIVKNHDCFYLKQLA